MNKLTKGSLATGAGLVLLLGGTGTFMSWNDTGTANGGTVTAGHLTLSDTTQGTWTSSANGGAEIASITDYRVVPGETLTYTANLTIDAAGDQLKATAGVVDGSIVAANAGTDATQQALNNALLADLVDEDVMTSITGLTETAVGSGVYNVPAGTRTVTVTATFPFPAGTVGDNDSQKGQVDLTGTTIQLNQTV